MKNLEQAVIEQLGYSATDPEVRETLTDVSNHGASGGVGGFIYHSDTIEFFDNNRESIMELAKNLADDLGESVYEMIASFNCLLEQKEPKAVLTPAYSLDEIVEVLHGVDNDASTQVKNAMSWFALEEVARSVVDV